MQLKFHSRIYRRIGFSFSCWLWKVLSSDWAFNNEHTGTGEAAVSAKFHGELLKQWQTSMSWDVMSCIDEYSQDVDCQLASRRITAWTVSLTDIKHTHKDYCYYYHYDYYNDNDDDHDDQGCEVLVLSWDFDSTVKKFTTPDSNSGMKNPGLLLRAKNQTLTPTLGLTVWYLIAYLRMAWEKF